MFLNMLFLSSLSQIIYMKLYKFNFNDLFIWILALAKFDTQSQSHQGNGCFTDWETAIYEITRPFEMS